MRSLCPALFALAIGCSGASSAGSDNGLTTTERVTYRPETIVVPTEGARSMILAESDDDANLLLDGARPEIADLAPGKVLLLGGVALRKVTAVTREGTSVRVLSEPAALTDAIEEGELRWSGKIDWSSLRQIQTNLPGSGVNPQSAQPWSSNVSVGGKLGDWKYAFTGSVKGDTLTIKSRIEAEKSSVDAWVEVQADVERPQIDGDIEIHGHETQIAKLSMSSLKTKVTVSWGAQLNVGAASIKDILWMPIDFPVPILPTIPLFFRASANFAFVAGLVGKGTAAGGHYEFTFNGSSSAGGAASEMAPTPTGDATASGDGDGAFNAIGGSALGVVVNAPRLGVSLGIPKVADVLYSVGGVLEMQARASGPLGGPVACRAFDLTLKATTGIDFTLLGLKWGSSQDLGAPFKKSWATPTGSTCGG